jgi:hypothetical protein
METTVGIAPAMDASNAKEQQQARELQVNVIVQPKAEEEGEDAQQTRDIEEELAELVNEAEVAVVVGEIVADAVTASEQSADAEYDVAPVIVDAEAAAESVAVDEEAGAAATATKSEETEKELRIAAEQVVVSSSEARITEETASETTLTAIETTETKTTVTETTSVETTVVESTTTEAVNAEEIASKEVAEEEAATEDATPLSSNTEETTTTTEEDVTEKVATEAAVDEEIVSATSLDTEAAIETLAVEEDAGVVSVAEESFVGEATTGTDVSEEAKASAGVIEDVAVESATAEEVSTEKVVVDEVTTEGEVGERAETEQETTIEIQNSTAAVNVTEATSVVTEDSLSREAAEVVANAVVERIVADVVASVDDVVLAESSAPRAINTQTVDDAAVIAAAIETVATDNAEDIRQEDIATPEQNGEFLDDAAGASADNVAEDELAQTSNATQYETENQAEATGEEDSPEHTSNAVVNQVDAESVEEKAKSVVISESVEVESVADSVVTSAAVASVESVAIETKSSDTPAEPSQTPELSTVPLDDEPSESAEIPSSSRSVSSDEEGWRSDDNDSMDGGDGSKKKKSRAFRSPVRSMISRFANKVSSSMPKKRLGAHRTESAAKLELESPSPVHGAVTRLESPQEDKPETHRTESAAKLDLEGNSPVKHIVHRFESPQHNSLDNLKIRTVRTFFDEKERSIHVDQEKEKYDSALKSVVEGEATSTKAGPTALKAAKPSSKMAEDATPAKELPPVSLASVEMAADESVKTTIDTSTVTPVKNMVSRFEKKPEQSLDNLSFRTVRTFFPTIEEPSIRVGAEKQKYEAVTEQQKAEVRRLEEEKLSKKKVAVESTAAEVEVASTSESVEEEHVFHVRDLAHQLEARSSLTRDLAPVSLSRSSSGVSERMDAVRTRLARSISNSSDRSSVSGTTAPPSLSRTTSTSSDRPPRFVTRSQSDASSHHGEMSSAEFHVKDVAQQFESRIPPSPQNAATPVRRSSAAEVTLSTAHSQLRRTSVSSAKDVPVAATSNEETAGEEEVFNVKSMAHRFEAASLSRQSSGVESVPTPTHVSAATPPRFRRNSSQGSASSTPATPAPATPVVEPATPKQVQVTANAVLETTPSANVRDIAHRFETNRAQSVETPAYRTMETFFNEVDEPSIRVRAEKAKLEALEKQKELEAKLAWAKSLHAEEEAAAAAAAAAAKKAETLHWFLMPAATNPAFVRLYTVLTDRDPMTALALFPRQEPAATETDSDLQIPLIPMDLPPFA